MLSAPANEKPFLNVFTGHAGSPPPLWLMRQAGRYLPEYRDLRKKAKNFLDMCYSPSLAAEITLQPIRRYQLDAAIIFSDILVVPDALGQNVRFAEGEGPKLEPLQNGKSLDALNLENIDKKLQPITETVRCLTALLPKKTALIGFCGAPWTVSAYMIEGQGSRTFNTIKRWIYDNPKDMERLSELLVEASIRHLSSQIRAGAEAIQIFDSWAGLLPELEFRRWVTIPTRRIIERLKKDFPFVPIIGFPRGAGALYEAFVAETGCHGIALDPAVPLAWAMKHLDPYAVIQGNLDPMALVVGGKTLDRHARNILEHVDRKKFIFNLGHGILPETPPGNIDELIKIVRSYG